MTKILVNQKQLEVNAKSVLKECKDYENVVAVTKGNGYGLGTKNVTKIFYGQGFRIFGLARYAEMVDTVAALKEIKAKPCEVLSLSVVEDENIANCIKNKFIVPITCVEQVRNYVKKKIIKGLRVQIALNTGMNRIGFNDKKTLNEAYSLLVKHGAIIVGIFSHIFENDNVEWCKKQFDRYEELLYSLKDWKKIKYCSIRASFGIANLFRLPKRSWENTTRPGSTLYGRTSYDKKLNDNFNAFKVVSEIAHINTVKKGERVGYGGTYVTKDTTEYIAVVPCGWGDGIPRNFNRGKVYVNNKLYPIVGRISMDSFTVKVDKTVKLGDTVEVFRDFKHACSFLENPNDLANVIAVICNFSINRVPRILIKK